MLLLARITWRLEDHLEDPVTWPLFQINGQILYGRSHQNATAIINNAPSKVKIILIR